MARWIYLTLASALLMACSSKEVTGGDSATLPSETPATRAAASTLPVTTVQFEHMAHDFGRITEGEKVSHTFQFTNTGTEPLQITEVKPTCGCTTPNYSKEPIAPGAKGFVEVLFDSGGRQGAQNKTVQVFANTAPKVTTLTFTGEVVTAKK
ncbi:MAG: DUF1573 domain-containing protein [Bacteroidia bacterium]|nr:DUF1573 domain-containing protein [Bacteroidia bacterium]